MVATSRLSAHLQSGGNPFTDLVWTKPEQEACQGRLDQLAARWAVKEAVMKALGVGWPDVEWLDISVETVGVRPLLTLHGSALVEAERLGLTDWEISISHEDTSSDTLAMAFVVAQGNQWEKS